MLALFRRRRCEPLCLSRLVVVVFVSAAVVVFGAALGCCLESMTTDSDELDVDAVKGRVDRDADVALLSAAILMALPPLLLLLLLLPGLSRSHMSAGIDRVLPPCLLLLSLSAPAVPVPAPVPVPVLVPWRLLPLVVRLPILRPGAVSVSDATLSVEPRRWCGDGPRITTTLARASCSARRTRAACSEASASDSDAVGVVVVVVDVVFFIAAAVAVAVVDVEDVVAALPSSVLGA